MKKIKKLALSAILTATLSLLIYLSPESREEFARSVRFCIDVLIPSVFPFAVLGSLAGSELAAVPEFITSVVGKLFGTDKRYSKALLFGLVFGFPTGASAMRTLPLESEKNVRDYRVTAAISCVPGMAFTVLGVGRGLLGSSLLGAVIYLSNMLASLAVGCTLSALEKKKYADNVQVSSSQNEASEGVVLALCDSVTKAGGAMITVCAFVVFFSQISLLLSILPLPNTVSFLLSLLLEVGGATKKACEIPGNWRVLLSCFAISWSGLSVQMQTVSMSRERTLGLNYVALVRLCVSVTATLVCSAFLVILDLA